MSNQNIPKFESTVAIQPTRVPNVQSSFAALGSVFGQISQGALGVGQRIADKQASLAGTEAGQEPGLKLAEPVTEATRAFNEAAISSNKSFLDANVRESYQELYANVTDPKNFNSLESDPLGKFNQESPGIAADILKNALPENKLAVRNAINYYHGKYVTNIAAKVQTRAYNAESVYFHNELNAAKNESYVTASQGNKLATEGHYSNTRNLIDNAVKSGLISPEQGALEEKDVESSITSNYTIGAMANALSKGGSQGGIDFIGGLIKSDRLEVSMSPLQRDSVVVTTQGMLAEYQSNANVDFSVLKTQMKVKLDQILQGFNPDVNQHISRLLATGRPQAIALGREFQQRISGYRFIANFMKTHRFTSFAQRQVQIEAAEQVLRGTLGVNSRQIIHMLLKQEERRRQTLLNDSAGYAQASPIYKSSLVSSQVALSAQEDGASPEKVRAPLLRSADLPTPQISRTKKGMPSPQSNEILLALEREQRVPEDKLAIYSNTQNAAWATQFNALPPLPRALAVGKLLSQPENIGHAGIIMKGLLKMGMTPMTQLAVHAATSKESSSLVPMIIQSESQTPKERAATQKNILEENQTTAADMTRNIFNDQAFQDYRSSLISSSQGDISTTIDGVEKSIERLTYTLTANNADHSLVNSRKTAIKLVLANNFHYTNVNNHAVRVPSQVPLNLVRPYLDQAKQNALLENIQPGKVWLNQQIAAGIPRNAAIVRYKEGVTQRGYWGTTGDNARVVLLDDQKNPVLTTNGQQIEVSFKDIRDPLSDINQQIDALPTTPEQFKQAVSPGPLSFQVGKAVLETGARLTEEVTKPISAIPSILAIFNAKKEEVDKMVNEQLQQLKSPQQKQTFLDSVESQARQIELGPAKKNIIRRIVDRIRESIREQIETEKEQGS